MVRQTSSKAQDTGIRVQENQRSDAAEWRMISMLERYDKFKAYEEQFKKLEQGTLTVPAFFQELSHEAMMVMVETLRAEDAKLAYQASQDVLDRAGYGKTQKIAVGHVHIDHETSKRELINTIMSLAKKSGVKVKDEDHVQGHLDSGDVIDVGVLQVDPTAKEAASAGPTEDGSEAKNRTPNDRDK